MEYAKHKRIGITGSLLHVKSKTVELTEAHRRRELLEQRLGIRKGRVLARGKKFELDGRSF